MIVPEFAPLEYRTLKTAIGALTVAGDAHTVRHIRFEGDHEPDPRWVRSKGGAVRDAEAELREYFTGARKTFDVPIGPRGTTFQQSVWKELLAIPYGETLAYGEIARRIGQPTASRAVGAANGANPIPIIIPCHRAVGADGSMTGFGGGIATKRKLLALEAGQRALE